MIKVSEDFKNRMQDYTDFKERAEIILLDGTILEFNEDDFTLSNNIISDGAGVSSIPLGVAVGRSVQLELMNDDDHLRKYNFIGAKIRLYLTFYLENEEKNVIADKEGDALATTEGLDKIIASSPYSKIEYGLFTVISPETYGTTVIITGYDDMYKANQAYDSKLIFPATAGEVLRDCCSNCGISLKTSEFKNSNVQIPTKPSTEYTYRQVIGYIAMIAAGNARINRSGYLEVLTYTFDYSNGYNSLTEWINLKTDTDDIVITGISTEIADEDNNKTTLLEGDKGYVLFIENPLMAGSEKTLLSLIGEVLIGIAFRKFEGDYIAYPLAEFMDLAKITDLNGNVYNTFITDVNFVFFGQTTIKNSAESGIRIASSYQSPYQKAIIETGKIVEDEKTERQTAMENLKKALENAGGMYSTYEELPDGSAITYIHDKKELKDSQNVIKITSEAVGVSNDGGKTYPYGFVLTGELIAKLLYVEGIDADYINTGAITIKDSEDNIIFSVNMDTKKIYISGDNVQIGGKALSDKLEEIENSMAISKNMSMQLSNEYQAIPVDSEGKYEEFPDTSTQITVFYGDTDITNDCSYSIVKSDYVHGNWNSSSHVYTITELSADSGWVDIKSMYLNSLSLTRRFSIAKLYAGQKGLQGLQGEKGEQGVPGKDGINGTSGADGKTSYFHIKYASVENPTSAQMTETPSTYIGTYVDFAEADSTDPTKYSWSRFQGAQGEKGERGIAGVGEDGKTSYLHIAYANSSDGKTGFSVSDSANKAYIGQYTDFEKNDSADPAKYSWSKIKGDDGTAGRTYFIEASVNMLKRTKDNTVTPSSITFSAYYRDGNSTSRTAYSGRFIIEETSNGSNWKTLYTSSSNESSITRTIQQLSVSDNATSVRCKLYAAGGTSQLIDMQSISILVDIDNLTQEQVFNILTNNGTAKGIYKEGENLYVNANYLVTGILADKSKNNYWDLDKGELVTKLAQIGGWNVNENAIYKDVTIDSDSYRVYFQPPNTNSGKNTWVFSIQKKINNSYQGLAVIKADGSILSYSEEFNVRIEMRNGILSFYKDGIERGKISISSDGSEFVIYLADPKNGGAGQELSARSLKECHGGLVSRYWSSASIGTGTDNDKWTVVPAFSTTNDDNIKKSGFISRSNTQVIIQKKGVYQFVVRLAAKSSRANKRCNFAPFVNNKRYPSYTDTAYSPTDAWYTSLKTYTLELEKNDRVDFRAAPMENISVSLQIYDVNIFVLDYEGKYSI